MRGPRRPVRVRQPAGEQPRDDRPWKFPAPVPSLYAIAEVQILASSLLPWWPTLEAESPLPIPTVLLVQLSRAVNSHVRRTSLLEALLCENFKGIRHVAGRGP
jgi:hypothetical protein